MTDMTLEYAELRRAVADVDHVADQLEHGRTTLHSSFAEFLGTGWQGDAADSFRDGWDSWAQGVADVVDALRSMSALLTDTGRSFADHDQVNSATMQMLQSRLGGPAS